MKGTKDVQTIHKTFNECVDEIEGLEAKRKDIAARAPKGEPGKPIEMFTIGYGETVAEIDRLELIKRMSAQAVRTAAAKGKR